MLFFSVFFGGETFFVTYVCTTVLEARVRVGRVHTIRAFILLRFIMDFCVCVQCAVCRCVCFFCIFHAAVKFVSKMLLVNTLERKLLLFVYIKYVSDTSLAHLVLVCTYS